LQVVCQLGDALSSLMCSTSRFGFFYPLFWWWWIVSLRCLGCCSNRCFSAVAIL
jgi:hypothetical protein